MKKIILILSFWGILFDCFSQSDFTLKISAYLEGALIDNRNEISNSGFPLMRDDLRFNSSTEKYLIPSLSPYKYPTQNFDITPHYTYSDVQNPNFEVVSEPDQVFAVEGENAIVDWVFVELRNPINHNIKLTSRSALIQRDGDIVDVDGVSNVLFENVSLQSFYVVLRHRNHLGVMSGIVNKNTHVDFRSVNTQVFDLGNTKFQNINYTGLATSNKVLTGYKALWAGDVNSDGKIKLVNPGDDLNEILFELLNHKDNTSFNANFNFAYGYLQSDIDMNGKCKFNNPDDDANLLYSRVINYSKNEKFFSNFNFFIEQLPSR
jgi:hypothetical protein